MEKYTYTIIVVIITLVISTVLLGIGYAIGIQSDFMIDIHSVNNLEKETIQASILLRQIQNIDEGKIEKARQLINLELDQHIVSIDVALSDYPKTQKDDKNRAKRLLHKVAEHRKKYSNNANYQLPTQGNIDINSVIEETLEKYEEN